MVMVDYLRLVKVGSVQPDSVCIRDLRELGSALAGLGLGAEVHCNPPQPVTIYLLDAEGRRIKEK